MYFQPFSSIRLDRMSAAFGWTVDEVEQQVVALIQSGDIQGRVDSQNKVCSCQPRLTALGLSYAILLTDTASKEDRLPCRSVC